MKKINYLFLSLGIIGASTVMQSCLDDDDDSSSVLPSAVVTVIPDQSGSFVMQLDPSTTLVPVNLKSSPFGDKTVRALLNYEVDRGNENYGGPVPVKVNWIDSIMTKQLAENLGKENVIKYGNDPIEIMNDWVTVAECGYLTLRVRVQTQGFTKHSLNLVWTPEPDNQLNFTLFHNAFGDYGGRINDSLIAFDLLPAVGSPDSNPDITVNWKSPSGNKHVVFKMNMVPDSEQK